MDGLASLNFLEKVFPNIIYTLKTLLINYTTIPPKVKRVIFILTHGLIGYIFRYTDLKAVEPETSKHKITLFLASLSQI